QAAKMKLEFVINRIAHRFGLAEQTLWARLAEVRRGAREKAAQRTGEEPPPVVGRAAKAEAFERELLEVLLADAELVPVARAEVKAEDIRHPGLRRLLDGLYALIDEGGSPDLDGLRLRIADNPLLADYALRMREVGLMNPERPVWLAQVLEWFRERRAKQHANDLQSQLKAAQDPGQAQDLLRRLMQRQAGPTA